MQASDKRYKIDGIKANISVYQRVKHPANTPISEREVNDML
jgi:hypothetical protein